MSINYGIANDICIIDIEEFFTSESSIDIKNYIQKLIDNEEKLKGIIINFEKISFIDSAFLGIIASIIKKTQKKRLKLALCGLNSSVRSVFSVSRLDQIIDIYSKESEAFEVISQ